MKIQIISQYFWPSEEATSQLATSLAESIHSQGVYVYVITQTNGLQQKGSILIRRSLKSIPKSLTSLADTLLQSKTISGIYFFLYILFHALASRLLAKRSLVYSNPPFICVALLIAKKLRPSIDYIFVFQDLFPQSAVHAGILPANGPISNFWKCLIYASCMNATNTIVLSEDMKRTLLHLYPNLKNVKVIPNWAIQDKTLSALPEKDHFISKLASYTKLKILYSGNMGTLHEFITILEAARLLQHHEVSFIFVGHGPKTIYVEEYKKTYNLSNIQLYEPVPRCLLNSLLAIADIALITTACQSETLVAPSKYYGILAASKPVLYIGNTRCQLATEINEYNCGFTLEHGDVASTVSTITDLLKDRSVLKTMGARSEHLYQQKYDEAQSKATYLHLLKS